MRVEWPLRTLWILGAPLLTVCPLKPSLDLSFIDKILAIVPIAFAKKQLKFYIYGPFWLLWLAVEERVPDLGLVCSDDLVLPGVELVLDLAL